MPYLRVGHDDDVTALTYAGLMSAGPFFVSRKEVGLGKPSVVLDMDKMACYVAEKVSYRLLYYDTTPGDRSIDRSDAVLFVVTLSFFPPANWWGRDICALCFGS